MSSGFFDGINQDLGESHVLLNFLSGAKLSNATIKTLHMKALVEVER